jgi:hypothetical protein
VRKANSKEFSDERPSSGTPEETPTEASVGGPAPIYEDESFARRAGEIIARAVRAAGRGLKRGSKRKY